MADREVEITLKRTWRHHLILEKIKMIVLLLMGLLIANNVDDQVVESF